MNTKRITKYCVILVILLIWAIRYVTLNHGFKISNEYQQEFYSKGDTVTFDDNMSCGIKYFKDYSICVDDFQIYDTDEYIHMLNKTQSDFGLLIPEKIVELTVTLKNNGNSLGNGVEFYGLTLVGTDWYSFYNSEFTAYANTIYDDNTQMSYGIIVPPDTTYTMKIIYDLPKCGRSNLNWQHISKEKMSLRITYSPISKLIALNM